MAVAVWLLAARALWDTALPAGLELPSVDVRRTFGAGLVDRTERYESFLLAAWALSQLALLAALVVYARRGAAFQRESAAGPIGTGMLLGMLGLALAWGVQQPFTLATVWWDRRNDVSEVGYVESVIEGWSLLVVSFVLICIALLVVMALARWLGEIWWIPGAAVFIALVGLFSWLAPQLSTELTSVDDPALEARYERLAASQGVGDVPLRLEVVSGDTSQANAYAWGIGDTRQIVLWDTLLDGRFSDDEVDVVLAHELGHHSSGHLTESIGWFALFALPGAWLLMRTTRRRGGMGEPAAIPVALLVVVVFQLAASPLQNTISRENEREADWKALESTGDPAAARGLFREFAQTSLGDPSPPTWAYLLLSTHPTLAQRVAMAEAWARSHPGGS